MTSGHDGYGELTSASFMGASGPFVAHCFHLWHRVWDFRGSYQPSLHLQCLLPQPLCLSPGRLVARYATSVPDSA
eukprot:3730609-Rhodomonas_salina.2